MVIVLETLSFLKLSMSFLKLSIALVVMLRMLVDGSVPEQPRN